MTEFWKQKSLADMSPQEWESLCDGCGKCCLLKLEDEDSGEVHYTDVACKLLDCDACACSDYPNRVEKVPTCRVLSPENLDELDWLPSTCGYRLIKEGRDLFWWHPLVSGEQQSVHQAGMSIQYRVLREDEVDEADLPDRIVAWPT